MDNPSVPPGTDIQVRQLLSQGQKIDAIRLVRQQTGCGLAQAKAYCEAIARGETPLQMPQPLPPQQSSGCAAVVALIIALVIAIVLWLVVRGR